MLNNPLGRKVIMDPIHGYIDIPSYALEIIDTPQFQRLRYLKQLGVSYFIFPGASHNRFEHSVGVFHLARTFMERIRNEQPELEVTNDEFKCVTLAGLCHDLGHGPFSHAFEAWVRRDFPLLNFHHEDMSLKLFDLMVDENSIDMSSDNTRLIKAFIKGENYRSERHWLFDIVANRRNSIDVDKFDYISRDSYSIGIKSSYDSSRLLRFSRVIDDEICYYAKESYNIYEMFHTRYSLFKQIYLHRVGNSIEHMISDIFSLANGSLKISSKLDTAEEYQTLTDDILLRIEYSKKADLKDARDLVRRLRKRQLYTFVDEFILSTNDESVLKVTPQQIYDCKDFDSVIDVNNIIVSPCECNYAMKKRNPVDNVSFYNSLGEPSKFRIPKEQVSLLIPEQFSETFVRIYSKDSKQVEAIQKAFRNYLQQVGHNPENISPLKPKIKVNRLPM